MKYNLRMFHRFEGGTGLTNFTVDMLYSISRAMEICKIEGMTIVNLTFGILKPVLEKS